MPWSSLLTASLCAIALWSTTAATAAIACRSQALLLQSQEIHLLECPPTPSTFTDAAVPSSELSNTIPPQPFSDELASSALPDLFTSTSQDVSQSLSSYILSATPTLSESSSQPTSEPSITGSLTSHEPVPSTSQDSSDTESVSYTSESSFIIASGSSSANATDASSASASSTSSASPARASLDPVVALMRQRRLSSIVGSLLSPVLISSAPPSNIQQWISTLDGSGKWPDSEINYLTGCAAQRANWPAQWHWQRILVMSSAWHGGLQWDNVQRWVANAQLRDAINRAVEWWFGRDFENVGCLVNGGTTSCPCGTTGLWNTNWYSNVILIPNLVAQVCLLLDTPPSPDFPRLTESQIGNCTKIVLRAYGTFDHGYGFTVGANVLDIAKGGIDEGLLIGNVTMLEDAYDRVHEEVSIQTQNKADGIRPDGSFGQHVGIIYNGNYGKDYLNADMELELIAAETPFAADASSIAALEVLFDGDRWMVFQNTELGIKQWDTSVVSRFISFAVVDGQANAAMGINLTKVETLGNQWDSNTIRTFGTSLSPTTSHANAGNLVGNRVFYNNDYMVHRGKNYVSTLRMYSSRTLNTECVNSQNPLGFHLSDGTRYTYVYGAEYQDIAAAWDWNLVPGTTTDYENTPLNCGQALHTGVESFVGGVTTGTTGIGVMKYTNPLTKQLSFQKAWFFLKGDREHVMIGNIRSNSSAPVYSVLDQKRHKGKVLVDGRDVSSSSEWNNGGSTFKTATNLWHNNVGYVFPRSMTSLVGSNLVVKVGQRFGNYSTIGTSTQPTYKVGLFTAYLDHSSFFNSTYAPTSYTTFPAISSSSFESIRKAFDPTGILELRNDPTVSAIIDNTYSTLYAVFWGSSGGEVLFRCPDRSPAKMTSSRNVAVVVDLKSGDVTVSDPGQSAGASVTLTMQGQCVGGSKSLRITLPGGLDLGKSVVRNVSRG